MMTVWCGVGALVPPDLVLHFKGELRQGRGEDACEVAPQAVGEDKDAQKVAPRPRIHSAPGPRRLRAEAPALITVY